MRMKPKKIKTSKIKTICILKNSDGVTKLFFQFIKSFDVFYFLSIYYRSICVFNEHYSLFIEIWKPLKEKKIKPKNCEPNMDFLKNKQTCNFIFFEYNFKWKSTSHTMRIKWQENYFFSSMLSIKHKFNVEHRLRRI